MKSREGTISEDRHHRPALATGLPAHRVPVRQASPRRRGGLWSRRSLQFIVLVLAGIVVGALLYVGGATGVEVAQPPASPVPDVVESAPDSGTLADVPDEPAIVTPMVVPAAETTSAPAATVMPATIAPTSTPVAVTATPVPQATEASTPPVLQVWVGNTGGSGVYVRGTPSVAHRLRAYDDGTQLTVIGDDVTGEGQQWKHIRTPDGLEGYVPAQYVIDTAP